MAVLAVDPPTFLALDHALNDHDFQKSRTLYNGLKSDEDQPPVEDQHIQDPCSTIRPPPCREDPRDSPHPWALPNPGSAVMVGTNFQDPDMRWAKTTDIKKLEQSSVYGHIFVLVNSGLCAYEFQDGPLPDLSNVGHGFLAEFSCYITSNNLAGLIGLRVLGGGPCRHVGMFELVLDQRTIMLGNSIVKGCRPTRVTGWTFESSDGKPRVCQSNETHAEMSSGNHKVFNSGKPLPKLENVDDIKAVLVEAGVM
ncbi:hypothetical protein BN1723_006240 [Verticillium longisporum]|uniref:Uncharacterized protein n=1 Tax=Verticillium longisporum TaxID=100787 RepID=A0A0G4NDS6_VERLO|nr:hypothetical protein BN1723_006240 [Verticillium longisporum]